MIKTIPIAFACAIAANSAALAAAPAGLTLSADKKIVYANHPVRTFTARPAHNPALTPIFDNLASLDPKGVYMAGTGNVIGGPTSPTGQAWLAAAFTPTANATVSEVDVGAGYIEGAQTTVRVHLYADASGLPGQELWSRKVALPIFGDCCMVAVVPDKAGIPVTAGTQYWVGITTDADGPDSFDAWCFNVADQVDAGVSAVNQGSGWVPGTSLPPVAFAVYGKS